MKSSHPSPLHPLISGSTFLKGSSSLPLSAQRLLSVGASGFIRVWSIPALHAKCPDILHIYSRFFCVFCLALCNFDLKSAIQINKKNKRHRNHHEFCWNIKRRPASSGLWISGAVNIQKHWDTCIYHLWLTCDPALLYLLTGWIIRKPLSQDSVNVSALRPPFSTDL